MTRKVAAITGITGQDGSYLAELLLSEGYEVHGLRRRSSSFNTARINHLYTDPFEKESRLFLHYGDMSDSTSLIKFLNDSRPTEVYNLAAQSHVAVSFETPEYTAETSGLGALRILEAMRTVGIAQESKFYQASTSELFGGLSKDPYDELSSLRPRSPYATAKLFAYWTTINYRESYGMWAANGILFNHESPRRGETFVTRKITRALSRIKHGLQNHLVLGNLDATRDWGHASDYVRAMWLMMGQETPSDYVIATGHSYSVREFVSYAAAELGVDLCWVGSGLDEQGLNKDGEVIVSVDKGYWRPSEVANLLGDAARARKELNWEPKVSFETLVSEMVRNDENECIQELKLNK